MLDLLVTLQEGGWTMLALGLASLVGLAIILERGAALRRHRVMDPALVQAIRSYSTSGEEGEVEDFCRQSASPLARVIEEVLRARNLEHAQALEAMHAAGRTQVGRLERGLTVLEIVAAVSPLLGLLGTVLGMVTIFDAISAQGLGDPQILSAGISKALITTVAGLCVAIPALAFHSLYMKRVEDLATEMQDYATTFILRMHEARL